MGLSHFSICDNCEKGEGYMSIKDDEIRDNSGHEEEKGLFDRGSDDDVFFGKDEDASGAEQFDTLEIPTLDGIEREPIDTVTDSKSEYRPQNEFLFPEIPLEEEDDINGGERFFFDPRDEEELSISSESYPEEDISEYQETDYRDEMPRQKKRYTFSFGFVVGMTVVIVAAALGVAIAMYAGYDFGFGVTPPTVIDTSQGETERRDPAETEERKQTGTQAEAGTQAQPDAQTEPISSGLAVKSELASEGALVLVNKTHKYTFPDIATESLYSFKNGSYKLSSSTIELEQTTANALNEMAAAFEAATGKHDLIVASGIRSYDEQLELYSARVEKYGIENAKKYVAEPGHSEHHTGLSFDLSVYTDEGEGMLLSDAPEYAWVIDHCYEYGFIRRYDDKKADITGISEEDWHFRYVGRAHAYYMSANELCLEEYIELVKKYTFENRLGFNEPTGTRYEVYFVPVSSGEETDIPIPQENGITTDVSGTGSGGFIVTVTYN